MLRGVRIPIADHGAPQPVDSPDPKPDAVTRRNPSIIGFMPIDPFEQFELPRDFDIDLFDLEKRYLAAAARSHPDRFTDDVQKRDAEQRSARLNQARDVLRDDERRARALLALHDPQSTSDDKSLPDGFLMDILETREMLEEAIASDDPDQQAKIEQWAQQQRTQYRQQIADLFAQFSRDQNPEALTAIRLQLNAWRYIERLLEQLA